MNKIIKFLKFNKLDLLLVFILSLLVYKAWHLLPQLTIRHDGFVYLLNIAHEQYFKLPFFFVGFENSAVIFGFIFSKVFGINLPLYYWIELLVMLSINVVWYFTIKKISKNRFVAFSAALMLAVNYFGMWDMVTDHCYCFFLERVIPVLFLIPSILFLQDFLEKKNKKSFLISLLFYFFGLGIGHFVVLFTPLYLFYPIFWFFFEEKKFKDKIKGVLYGSSYLGLSALFIRLQQINESGLGPHQWTFAQFLLNPQKYLYVKKIFLQLVYWSQYPVIVSNYIVGGLRNTVETTKAEILIPYIISIYIIAGIVIYKKLPRQRAMLFTILFGTITIFYLNAYFNEYDMLNFSGSSRYLYFPSFLLTLFWTLFLWAVFWRKIRALKLLGIIILILYYIINVWLIDGNFHEVLSRNRSSQAVLSYIISTRSKLQKSTLIIGPYPQFGSQESTFFTEQLGKGGVRYMSDNNLVNSPYTWENVSTSSAYVIKLKYDKKCDCVVEEKIK